MVVYINFDEGVKRVVNNTKLYIKILGKFLEDTSINELEAAFSENNMVRAQTAAHTLKGLAGNLSLTELYNQCLELENQIKANTIQIEQFNVVKNVYSLTVEEVEKIINRSVS